MKDVVNGTQKLLKELRAIGDNTENAINAEVAKIVKEATELAKSALANTDHTQAGGDDLVEEIGFRVKRGQGYVFAPCNTDTPQMRNRMFYAEYGAGKEAEGLALRQHKTSPYRSTKVKLTAGWWRYYSTDHDKLEEAKRNFRGRLLTPRNKSGAITRPYRYQSKKSGKWIGVTNTSKPARYMATARNYIINNAGDDIAKVIGLAIARRRSGHYHSVR